MCENLSEVENVSAHTQGLVAVTYEDRPSDFVGVALLVLTLSCACPELRLIVFGKNVPVWFEAFASRFPQVELRLNAGFSGAGWSVKPEVLLRLLDEGWLSVTWLDSDLLATPASRTILLDNEDLRLAVGEEPYWTSLGQRVDRAAGWGWKSEREFARSLNSCVIRVREAHRGLLEEWAALLLHPDYLTAQMTAFSARPPYVASDQDVLEALLCRHQFADLPIRMIRSGREIAQCHLADGYTLMDRCRYLCGQKPGLIHSQGFKPWRSAVPRSVDQDVSPYLLYVMQFKSAFPLDSSWMAPQTVRGAFMRAICGHHLALSGALPAAWCGLQRRVRIRSRLRTLRELLSGQKLGE